MPDDLKKLRIEIDGVDKAIVEMLAKRFEITRKIGKYKKEQNLLSQDIEREKQILAQRKFWAQEHGLDDNLVDEIFKIIVKKVVKDNE